MAVPQMDRDDDYDYYFRVHQHKAAGMKYWSKRLPKAWNHLPADIRAIDTVSAFKTALKIFLFRQLV